MIRTLSTLAVVGTFGFTAFGTAQAAVLIADDFDNNDLGTGGTNGGFTVISNTTTPSGSASEAGTLATITTANANTPDNTGIYSNTSADLSSLTNFTMTFVVDGLSGGQLQSNGLFLGIAEDNSSFYITSDHFGLYIDAPGTNVGGDNDVVLGGRDGAGSIVTEQTLISNFTNAELNDGFTVSLTVFSDDTYSYNITGLGSPASGSGSLSTLTYAGLFDDAADHLVATAQRGNNGQVVVDIDSVSLETTVIPEPASLMLLSMGGLLIAGRRRRSA